MRIIPEAIIQKLISSQFPELSQLSIREIDRQGHDNRTYRLGDEMLIRLPTMDCYFLAVEKEQKYLPLIKRYITADIPVPLKMGSPSELYPYQFSIYKWLEGKPLNTIDFDDELAINLAYELSQFLNELRSINNIPGPLPGQHNWWRGDHVSVYDEGFREQIKKLSGILDQNQLLTLWERACKTKWTQPPVWIHGDFAADNILIKDNKLSAVIDFGCTGIGDPACDLVIAWTYFKGKSRELFIKEINLDEATWLRAKAWALWKATFELSELSDHSSLQAVIHLNIIDELLNK